MKPREVLTYLYDIRTACDLILQFVEGRSYEDYLTDALLRSAVERQFEIVGEALNKATKLDPALYNEISDAKHIISFRNRLIHGYATVAHDVVWNAIESHLPTLAREVSRFLDESPIA